MIILHLKLNFKSSLFEAVASPLTEHKSLPIYAFKGIDFKVRFNDIIYMYFYQVFFFNIISPKPQRKEVKNENTSAQTH